MTTGATLVPQVLKYGSLSGRLLRLLKTSPIVNENLSQQPDLKRFLHLVDRHFAGILTDDEAVELIDLADRTPEWRKLFSDQFQIDYLLRLLEQAESEVLLTPSLIRRYDNTEPDSKNENDTFFHESFSENLLALSEDDLPVGTDYDTDRSAVSKMKIVEMDKRRLRLIGLSISLLAVLVFAVYGGRQLFPIRNMTSDPLSADAENPALKIGDTHLARIVRLNNARWKDPSAAGAEWNHVSKGQQIRLESGSAEIIFNIGVQIILEGPAEMHVIDAKRIRISRGKLAARVGQKGVGFTIETPSGTIVDQGTEFGLDVGRQGDAKVIVFRGNVDVYHEPDSSDPAVFATDTTPVPLNAGEGLLFRRNGAPEPVAVIESDYFLPAAISRPPVSRLSYSIISSVRDNIRDGQKFYEIVPRGFGEDVPAYVDRLHEWNGITSEGLPDFLIGGDMVRTFNEDKFLDDFQMTLTLSAPARLFILLDERSDVPDWLRRDFTITNYLVGQDQGIYPHEYEEHYDRLKLKTPEERTPESFSANRLFEVGPGNSIDHIFTVWERKSTEPGKIVLGGIPFRDDRDRNSQSFYGIVAVPLSEVSQPIDRP